MDASLSDVEVDTPVSLSNVEVNGLLLQADVDLLALSPRMMGPIELQHLSPTPPSQEERALGSPLLVIPCGASVGVVPFLLSRA